jgi:hypothetical protein
LSVQATTSTEGRRRIAAAAREPQHAAVPVDRAGLRERGHGVEVGAPLRERGLQRQDGVGALLVLRGGARHAVQPAPAHERQQRHHRDGHEQFDQREAAWRARG